MMKDPDHEELDPESLSEEARQRLEAVEEALRLMGLDEDAIASMRKAMFQLYDPETEDFRLGDLQEFQEAMIPALLGSPVLADTLASRQLLEGPELKRFWFTEEQLQPCVDECDAWIAERLDRGETDIAEMFLDESKEEEREQMGEILYRHYEGLVTPELSRDVYDVLFELSKSEDEEQQRLAKTAMMTFTMSSGESNTILQSLFVKSFIHNTGIVDDLPSLVESKEQLEDLLADFEDSLFAMLCGADDSMWEEGDEEDWDEDWDDDDE